MTYLFQQYLQLPSSWKIETKINWKRHWSIELEIAVAKSCHAMVGDSLSPLCSILRVNPISHKPCVDKLQWRFGISKASVTAIWHVWDSTCIVCVWPSRFVCCNSLSYATMFEVRHNSVCATLEFPHNCLFVSMILVQLFYCVFEVYISISNQAVFLKM